MSIKTALEDQYESDGVTFEIDISNSGDLPVDCLVAASGLSKNQIKDAMTKGAVWLSCPILQNAPKPPADAVTDDGEPNDGELDDGQAADPWAKAWSKASSSSEAKSLPKPRPIQQYTGQYTKPKRLRRAKKGLKAGDRLSLHYDAKVLASTCPAAELIADEGSYSVWHKPAGMLCQGSRWGDHTTIVRWAENNLVPQRTAFVVHRIDRMTAGLLVVAHSKKAAAHLSKQFADRSVEKTYRAIVEGQFTSPLPFLIENALDEKACLTTIVSAQKAEQFFAVQSQYGELAEQMVMDKESDYSELEVRITTGRKHQVRRHLLAFGLPVVGDRLYGNAEPAVDLQLRSVILRLQDPETESLRSYYLTPQAEDLDQSNNSLTRVTNMTSFNIQSTTDDVLKGMDLTGKRVLITGATAGLGWESARALAGAGAEVIMTARDQAKYLEAANRILEQVPAAQLHCCELSLNDIDSCRAAAAQINNDHDSIDYIIANAGVMACEEQRTVQGFEWQFGVNHLGHFVFVNHLLPLLKSPDCRVAVLSSGGHRFSDVDLDDPNFDNQPYDKWQAYGRAKTANALYALELNKRMPFGHANAVHPGAIGTHLARHMPQEELMTMAKSMESRGIVRKSIECGAATQVWAITSPELEGKGGLYLEDCSVGLQSPGDQPGGYSAYALDETNASRLWALSETLVGEKFSS